MQHTYTPQLTRLPRHLRHRRPIDWLNVAIWTTCVLYLAFIWGGLYTTWAHSHHQFRCYDNGHVATGEHFTECHTS